jgi:hypothetical protein
MSPLPGATGQNPSSRGYCTHELTKRSDAGPIPRLANPTDLNCVDRGQRGELVEALLTMQACDTAGAKVRNRWVSVNSFTKELLPPSQYDILNGSYPRLWHVDEKASFN